MESQSFSNVALHLIGLDDLGIHFPGWLRIGTALEPGGAYLDLAAKGRTPFVAVLGQIAGSGNRYVARRDVPVQCWNSMVEGADLLRFGMPLANVGLASTRRPA
ncbi:MAG: hypothetical protein QOF01_4669 [Thermomicrobiales bacterium]|jgi:hypothetical protein|nr:hypothetical protein [Thermomicrobiales bacterium]